MIGYRRASRDTLTYDPGNRVLRAGTQGAVVAIPGQFAVGRRVPGSVTPAEMAALLTV